MNGRPLVLRTLIVFVVVLVFAWAIHPLVQRDYYETFLGMVPATSRAEAEQLIADAEALQKADPQLLSIYRNARKQVKSFPVIVALRDEKLCGCGIELSAAELGKLKDGEPFVTCPTCGRLVYKPGQ